MKLFQAYAALSLCLFLLPVGPAATAQETTAESPVAAAQTLFDAEEFSAAEASFAAIVAASPEDGEAWFGLGRSRHMLDDWSGALEAYDRALEFEFNPPRVMFHAARAAAGNGDLEATVEWLNRLADTGQKSYLAVVGAEEFDAFRDDTGFQQAADRLRPCGGPEFRHFDFWIGEWQVTNLLRPDSNAPPAINKITSLHDGCVLREEYQSPSGFTGTSLNFFDSKDGLWHQTWIDNQGQALYLSGGLVDGTMVLADPADAVPLNRISWTPLEEGRVRQLWEVSTDSGENWQVVFDGLYAPQERREEAD